MATIKGLKVLGREVEPGDVIMNEWSSQVMTVLAVKLVHGESVSIQCVRSNGRSETLEGNWDAVTRLITRVEPAYEPDEV